MKQSTLAVLGLLLVLGMLAVPPASAQSAEIQCDSGAYSLQDLQIAERYNENLDRIPSVLRGPLTGNTVEITIENSDVPTYHFTTNDNRTIVSYERGPADNEDVRIHVQKAAACRVIESDDPSSTFEHAYKSGEITIEGVGVIKGAEVFVVERILDAASFLGLW